MPDLQRFRQAIDEYIRPQTFPTAIRMVVEGEDLPPKVRRPAQDLGFQTAICQGFSIARRYGWTIAIGSEDLSCPLAKTVFGLAPRLPYYEAGHACAGMYTATPEAGMRTEAETPSWEYGQYRYIVIGPLHRADFEPHVILVYGTPAQVMRLVTATLWQHGGRVTSSFSGRIDCADAVIAAMKSGEPQVILPCYGDRIFGQTEEHEMAFSIPFTSIDAIVSGLEGTHRGGVRYPIPNFLRYTGAFPPHYEKMNTLWAEQQEPGTGPD